MSLAGKKCRKCIFSSMEKDELVKSVGWNSARGASSVV
ncbi:hypothetical protein CEXT_33481, partial [Caerostris extrusa]